jgi:transposase
MRFGGLGMKRFVEGSERQQGTLFPEYFEDFVDEDNQVRVVDAFVDALNLNELGFAGTTPAVTGRPGYHPSVLLKIYVYGYLNRIQSSRRLEREAQRNVEVMWLTGRLAPDFKTIADFRRDNGKPIVKVCRQFVMLCRQIGLLGNAMVAIDGSKFKAVNNRDKNFTSSKMARRIGDIEASIERYLAEMDRTDRDEPEVASVKAGRLKDKITALKAQLVKLNDIENQLAIAPDKQVSLSDPDARSMKTRGGGIVGYNVQSAVEADHHLIVAHDVTNIGSDRGQLHEMSDQARAAMGIETITVVGDRGYYSGEELLKCTQDRITPYVPRSLTSASITKGLFDKRDFIYDPQSDSYRCPAGEVLPRRSANLEDGLLVYRYWFSKCKSCAIKSSCTTGPERRVRRWEHEGVLDAMQRRLDMNPDVMMLRRSTVEHPFGTIKSWMGATHFLTRTLTNVSTEMSLHVLAYNLKRVIKIIGIKPLLVAIRA